MSLLSVTPAEGVNISENELVKIAEKYGYQLKENEEAEFTTLLAATCNATQFVSEMDARARFCVEPTREYAENIDNAWAYRFNLASKAPTSDLLKGKTLCVKDNICVAGVPCLFGTEGFGWTPKTDATIVTRILEAGGTITGKAVCENLSTSAASFTSATGPVSNPYAKGYSAGGSSSGTANIVGKGECDMGIGADQGGSIRIPASLCGLVGLKATTGLIPYTGIISNEATIDYVGPMTQTVLDNAKLLEVIAGVDGLDDRQQAGTPFREQVPKYHQILKSTNGSGVEGLRIGILKEGLAFGLLDSGVKSKFLAAASVFRELGAIVEETSVPMHTVAPAIMRVMSNLGGAVGKTGRATGRRQVMLTDFYEKMLPQTPEFIEKMSPINKNALFSGEFCWDKYPQVYAKAVNLTRKLTEEYNQALKTYDILIMPTTITPSNPLPLETDSIITKMSKTIGKLENTCPFNISGHPALAFPIGFVAASEAADVRVPASMQVVGKYFDEITCLKVAYAWEKSQNWKDF